MKNYFPPMPPFPILFGQPTPDYVVTGDGDSEVGPPNGNYFDNGATNSGQPVYEHENGNWLIWLSAGGYWHISPEVGQNTPSVWFRNSTDGFEGLYVTNATIGRTSTGTATVAAGT